MRKPSVPVPTAKGGETSSSPARAKLEFPVAPEFDSRPPRIDPQVMLRRCAETMPWRKARPGEKERRLAEKITEEFVL
jgi:hypothetical protein